MREERDCPSSLIKGDILGCRWSSGGSEEFSEVSRE